MSSESHLFFEGVETLPRPSTHPVLRAVKGAPSQTVPTAKHDPFVRWLFGRSGLPIDQYRPTALHRRLAACLRALRVSNTADAQRAVEANPALRQVALSALLLGVSEFFRDTPVFDAIRQHVLPELSRRTRPLRVWSAACSHGQELYSVAMQFADADMLARTQFIGTDCRADATDRAKAGAYTHSEVADLPPTILDRHFVAEARHFVAKPHLRTALNWKAADLLNEVEPGPWDVVLCRNMVIYLDPHSAEDVYRRIVEQIREGGFLIVGKADHVPPTLGMKRLSGCIYHKPETQT
jgi:chemotaxis methyl-accepting protein methylase